MHQWDDLRFFISAAQRGSFAEAARELGADVATVSRRVVRLETALKATLFARSSTGLKLTAIGRKVFEDGLRVEEAVNQVRNALTDDQVGGTVRISASEAFGGSIIAPALPRIHAEHPDLKIELAANAGFLSATNREVDIAITLNAPSDPRLIVEPLTEYRLGLFASADYLETRPRPRTVVDLLSHSIVGYVEDLIYASELRYLEEIHPDLQASISSTSIFAQREAIAAGGGVGVLPFFLAGGLVQIFPYKISLVRRFWISTHKDVANTARIRFVRNWLKSVVAEKSSVLDPGRVAAHS